MDRYFIKPHLKNPNCPIHFLECKLLYCMFWFSPLRTSCLSSVVTFTTSSSWMQYEPHLMPREKCLKLLKTNRMKVRWFHKWHLLPLDFFNNFKLERSKSFSHRTSLHAVFVTNDFIIIITSPKASDPCAALSPVIVSITECSNRDGKRLPNRVQIVLDHLSLVADGEPGNAKWQHGEEDDSKNKNNYRKMEVRVDRKCFRNVTTVVWSPLPLECNM